MSDPGITPDFDAQHYERPNQKWTCGYARDGNACRRGPDIRGRCVATAECAPVLVKKAGEEKGRWRCTRPGGPCESGPLPDGTCCRPIIKCAPVPTLRTRRGQLNRAVVVASVAALLILLGGSWRGDFINPEAVSTPHSSAKFSRLNGSNTSHCAACHRAGDVGPSGLIAAALDAKPGAFAMGDLARARRGDMTAIDDACQTCHTRHAFHQPNVVRPISCSYCHREHQGAGRIPETTDAHCALCHGQTDVMLLASKRGAELPQDAFHAGIAFAPTTFHAARPAGGFTSVIHRFSEDHPEFRVHTDKLLDPNTLKFNHALHLTKETIPELSGGHKLECVDCHAGEASGASFQRVAFEKHCQVCHSLQFDPETPGLTLPHGDPDFVSAFLHSLPKQYADFAARSGVTDREAQNRFAQQKLQRLQAREISGEEFEKRVFFSSSTRGPEARVGSVSGPTQALYPGCAYCHTVTPDAQGQAKLEKPVFFERWMPRASFDHSKHTAVTCAGCHQAEKSRDTSDIILPTKNGCVSCHNPGGVRESCATCHSYHKNPSVRAGR